MYFFENYKKYQVLNVIYPGLGVSDYIPKNSIKKYKLEYFNIKEDISLYSNRVSGKIKLYLYIANPDEDEGYFSYINKQRKK